METTSSNSRSAPVFRRAVGFVAAILAAGVALAADVRVSVIDDKGHPLSEAVVWASVPGAKQAKPVSAEIVQRQKRFLPAVTVVPVGSTIRFPNRDDVQHHVYSFSPPKKFDLPLYIGESPRGIVFDQPGVVTLGCNIHDWMAANILVVDTPFFAISTAAGAAKISGLPAKSVVVQVWHARLRGAPLEWTTDLATGSVERTVALKLRPEFRRTPPDSDGGTYR